MYKHAGKVHRKTKNYGSLKIMPRSCLKLQKLATKPTDPKKRLQMMYNPIQTV
ncbi:hypothetical protein HanRHA438_Chr11g0488171 [Helianthus annuus]|uniref:Uncharacterized protein n=1 Tax=Helianthus annuus TaxID=4232 RepID=A0A9K3HM05_HELAN|nr:hypothetical protein HanXRQr2_Chr11g0474751 [Helianthus annuus]KAJ0507924.1 hypothetical protein HanIR_Chr11g0511561 [Helianthus annuus]KAJ0869347.1 hypothetical protein HanRHA438_Chr11g0488171 [Helianthus annuus]KAJ0873897.1 hypothetical protein HanPSC8_Chr11g0457791 [Helianthus annuus]